jgi:hypothetical protein
MMDLIIVISEMTLRRLGYYSAHLRGKCPLRVTRRSSSQ